MSRSSNLYDLQLIDSQLDRHSKRKNEIAKILADDSEITSAQKRLDKITEELNKAEKELTSAEHKVQDQRSKIKRTESRLYGGKITNPKELKDLQDESEALKRYLEVLEERQLERMLELDEVIERFEAADENLNSATKKKHLLSSDLTAEKSKIEKEIQGLETQRKNLTKQISPEDLSLYQLLRKKSYGVAVAKVNNRACSACGATLTAALHQAARSPTKISRCETCGRILFN
jgi:predicted  nucleic acid-binding Zn-ribbon protein